MKLPKLEWVALGGIIIMFLIGLYVGSIRKPSYVKDGEAKIKAYQHNIDSLTNKLKESDKKIDSLTIKNKQSDSLILISKNKIIYLKGKTDEKINSVNSYNVNDLNEFFTNRYKTGQ